MHFEILCYNFFRVKGCNLQSRFKNRKKNLQEVGSHQDCKKGHNPQVFSENLQLRRLLSFLFLCLAKSNQMQLKILLNQTWKPPSNSFYFVSKRIKIVKIS